MHILITYKKNLNPLNFAPQILPIKGECTFPSSNFLMLGLDNSSAKSSEQITSLLTVPTKAFLSKDIYEIMKQLRVDIHHILNF